MRVSADRIRKLYPRLNLIPYRVLQTCTIDFKNLARFNIFNAKVVVVGCIK